MPNENILTLREASQARTDFAVIEGHLEFIADQLARVPTRAYLCRILPLADGERLVSARRPVASALELGQEADADHRDCSHARLRGAAGSKRAPIPRGNPRISTRAPLPFYRAHNRRLSWLPRGSRLCRSPAAAPTRFRTCNGRPLPPRRPRDRWEVRVRPLGVPPAAVGRPIAWCAER